MKNSKLYRYLVCLGVIAVCGANPLKANAVRWQDNPDTPVADNNTPSTKLKLEFYKMNPTSQIPGNVGYFKNGTSTQIGNTTYSYGGISVFRTVKDLGNNFKISYYTPVISNPLYEDYRGGYHYHYNNEILENKHYTSYFSPIFKNKLSPVNDGDWAHLKSPGTMLNPNTGQYGEYRCIGYSSSGILLMNPLFPADSNITNPFWTATWQKNPWTKGNPAVQESEFDDPKDYTNWNKKKVALEKLIAKYPQMKNYKGGTADSWAYYLSLKTNPEYDTPMFAGVLSGGGYRTVTGPAKETLTNDMIMTKLEM